MNIKIFGGDTLAEKSMDLTGCRFGKLKVIKRIGTDNSRHSIYECICDCGKITTASTKSLKSGDKKSCGCIRGKNTYHDYTGEKIGNLTVIKRIGVNKSGQPLYDCVCDCGNKVQVTSKRLKGSKKLSCGCIPLVHGFRYERLYGVWSDIKSRCYNSNANGYEYYGGRGIKVCDEWRDNYKNFRDWAYSNGYNENADRGQCTIDRINVNGNYEPNNCRWVNMKIQRENQRPRKLNKKI